jgi:uncharacterized lipoprotein
MITEEELAIWQYGQQKKTISPSWEHLSEHAKLYWRTVASCLLVFLDSKGVRVLDENQKPTRYEVDDAPLSKQDFAWLAGYKQAQIDMTTEQYFTKVSRLPGVEG